MLPIFLVPRTPSAAEFNSHGISPKAVLQFEVSVKIRRFKGGILVNGELYQIACITAAAKHAMQSHTDIAYAPLTYEGEIVFQFLPEKNIFRTVTPTVSGVDAWYRRCLGKGLEDVKLLTPVSVTDRGHLGFANMTRASLVCFYGGHRVTYFTAYWEFDRDRKAWNICYTEHAWENAPGGKPLFKDNREAFLVVLSKISELALKLECDGFAKIFERAREILAGNILAGNQDKECTDGGSENEPDKGSASGRHKLPLPQIPAEHLPLFQAADMADVFGAMGSWNDSPPYMAYVKGLTEEYEALSAELLKNLRLAVMYAVNEW